jgi:hypothetical protein
MTPTLDQLAEHYREMPEEQLLQIALHEASGLTPEALTVLYAEIEARGLGPMVGRAVHAQTVSLSHSDIEVLVEAVRRQVCPECGRSERLLNGGVIADAKSFVLFTTFNKQTAIACPECLAALAKRAALMTAVLGWWGFPWGPIRTLQALANDIRTMRQRSREDATAVLWQFVEENPGVAMAFAERGFAPKGAA